MAYFVFLEFTNPKLREVLSGLRFALSDKTSNTSTHVTIRGPYDEMPDIDTLESIREKIQGYGVAISGSGIFKTGNSYIVYLEVKSPVFSEIWWKPDYKNERIIPHITIFETSNEKSAKTVRKFFQQERIEIFTLAITLTVYKSKQIELFEETLSKTDLDNRARFERWEIKPGLLERARKLRERILLEETNCG